MTRCNRIHFCTHTELDIIYRDHQTHLAVSAGEDTPDDFAIVPQSVEFRVEGLLHAHVGLDLAYQLLRETVTELPFVVVIHPEFLKARRVGSATN